MSLIHLVYKDKDEDDDDDDGRQIRNGTKEQTENAYHSSLLEWRNSKPQPILYLNFLHKCTFLFTDSTSDMWVLQVAAAAVDLRRNSWKAYVQSAKRPYLAEIDSVHMVGALPDSFELGHPLCAKVPAIASTVTVKRGSKIRRYLRDILYESITCDCFRIASSTCKHPEHQFRRKPVAHRIANFRCSDRYIAMREIKIYDSSPESTQHATMSSIKEVDSPRTTNMAIYTFVLRPFAFTCTDMKIG